MKEQEELDCHGFDNNEANVDGRVYILRLGGVISACGEWGLEWRTWSLDTTLMAEAEKVANDTAITLVRTYYCPCLGLLITGKNVKAGKIPERMYVNAGTTPEWI